MPLPSPLCNMSLPHALYMHQIHPRRSFSPWPGVHLTNRTILKPPSVLTPAAVHLPKIGTAKGPVTTRPSFRSSLNGTNFWPLRRRYQLDPEIQLFSYIRGFRGMLPF